MVLDRPLVERIEGLAAGINAEIADVLARQDPDGGAASAPLAGGWLVHTGAGMYVNRACGIGVAAVATGADLDVVEDFFGRRSQPSELEVCPWARGLLGLAAERGYVPAWMRSMFIRPLAGGDGAKAAAVATVDDQQLRDWLDVLAAGVEADGAARSCSDRFALAAHELSDATDLLARIDGVPAGAASLVVRAGGAWLGGMATVPHFRRRGVQSALIRHRLALAAAAGCDLAVSSAEPDSASARNLERHGFRVAYTLLGVQRAAPARYSSS